MDSTIAEIEKAYKRSLPAFAPGDTVRVRVRVVEGDKERIQPFEGVCIARSGSSLNETFTLRRVSGGVGVERIFPVHSPSIASLEVVRRGDVRRAKLYYLRARRGKRARVRERRWWLDAAAPGASVPPDAEMGGPPDPDLADGGESALAATGEPEAEAAEAPREEAAAEAGTE